MVGQGKHQNARMGGAAIIGMACIFPKAPNLQRFWQNIVSKVDAIDDPPEDSLTSRVYDPASSANNRISCKRGGYLTALPPFNPADFGIMPVALEGAEPEHFIALKVAYDALLDAGYPAKPFNRDRTEVILGRGNFVNRAFISMLQHVVVVDQTIEILKELHPEHTPEELEAIKARLKACLPPFTADTAPGLPHSVMAGIIANRLDLKGPCMVLDGACASCLLALDIAMNNLLSGRCDVALIGGVQISTPAPIHMLFTQLGALSRSPHLRPFDKDADGTMLGEGIGMMVLKRQEDAIRDGHRIYAVVKGVGASSDGKGKGLLAPQVEGEELALRRAYETAEVSPETISLIEAHGTGLPLGDITEIEALRRVFGGRDGGPPRVALGTVKSMIGHLIPAAGIAGLIKAALSIYHKILPPTLHVEEPNPKLEIDQTPFYLNTESRPWIHGSPHWPRRAGVSAFGFGGINTHAVLEEHPDQAATSEFYHRTWETELVLIEGGTRQELREQVASALEFLSRQSEAELVDIAYTLNRRLEGKPCRLALVAESPEDLAKKLKNAGQKLSDPNRLQIKDRGGVYFFENPLGREGKLAFLFPGEGSQYVNMLRDLCQHFPEMRACFDLLDRAFIGHPRNYLPSQIIFPPTSDLSEAGTRIWQLNGAVDAVITADRALLRVLTQLGISPQGIVGHSSGELMALEAAGAVALRDDEELVQLIKAGNQMIEALTAARDVPEGVLLAVGGVERQAITAAVGQASEFLALAMDNCPHQFVLCGTETAIAEAAAKFREQGGICQTLPFRRAYHTERFAPILAPLQDYFNKATVVAPKVPIYSCMTAGLFPRKPEEIRRYAVQQWAKPVRFRETIETMYADNFRIFLEVGPRGNLVSFVNDILPGKPLLAVATNLHHRSGITQLHHALAMLAAHGVALNPDFLYRRRAPRQLGAEAQTADEKRAPGVVLSLELPLLSLKRSDLPGYQGEPGTQLKAPEVKVQLRQREDAEVHFQALEETGTIPQAKPAALSGTVPPQPKFLAPKNPADPAPGAEVQAPMQEYLRTMGTFLENQEQVMLAYLRRVSPPPGRSEPPTAVSRPESGPRSEADVTPGTDLAAVSAAGEGKASPEPRPTAVGTKAAAGSSPLLIEDLIARLLSIISAKTGYPLEMLDAHQDLEADLGIDSIKRLEILGELIRQLGATEVPAENLGTLRTVAEIAGFLSSPAQVLSPAPREPFSASAPEPRPAFVAPELPAVLAPGGRIIDFIPSQEVRMIRVMDLEEDLFLRHHTLGGQVSQDHPELPALPLVPLSVSLEMMAAAAALLTSQPHLTGFRNIQVHDWLAVARGRLDLEINAQVQAESAAASEISVSIFQSPANQGEKARLAVEGLVIFGKEFPAVPAVGVFDPGPELPALPSPADFYPQALFHGALFRAVKEIRQAGTQGMEAVLQNPAEARFFRNQTTPRFLTSPVLLDGAGQVVGLWAIAALESNFVIFPAKLDEVSFYSPLGGLAAPLLCRVAPQLEGNTHICSDILLLSGDGTPLARLQGMHHQRAQLPKIFHLFRGSREVTLSRPWEAAIAPLASSAKIACHRLVLSPRAFSGNDGRIWLDVLAHIGLSQEERRRWLDLAGPDKRRFEWLLARIAGKEAVRHLLKENYGLEVWLADIEIYADERGRPLVRGEWLDRMAVAPVLSLTHSNGIAAALAAADGAGLSVGIDIESRHRPGKGFPDLAFAPEERLLLPNPEALEFEDWCLRFWCAKEAVGKALGRGLPNLLRDLRVIAMDPQTGMLGVEIANDLANEYPGLTGKPIQAYTAREGELIVASTLLGEVSTPQVFSGKMVPGRTSK